MNDLSASQQLYHVHSLPNVYAALCTHINGREPNTYSLISTPVMTGHNLAPVTHKVQNFNAPNSKIVTGLVQDPNMTICSLQVWSGLFASEAFGHP